VDELAPPPLAFDLFGENWFSVLCTNVKMGSIVVEVATMGGGIAIEVFTIEDVGVEIDAPVTLVTISLITGETIVSETLEVVVGFEPLLLLFPFGFSMFCLVFLGGGLTISGSDFPFLKSIH
jgi:hypothetical protein